MPGVGEAVELAKLREKFHAVWPEVLEDILRDEGMSELPEVLKWLRVVLNANVLQGKQNRGMACVHFYHQLIKNPTAEQEKLALTFGWVIEIWQAAAIMVDDMMDYAETRRGQKCWYKHKDVGLNAINDGFMLENLAYFLIYKYFSHLPSFSRVLRLTHDVGMKTVMGQSFDTMASVNPDVSSATMDKYRRIVKYKTSYYTFYHPFASAMAIADITDESLYAAVETFSMEIGFMFQVQDDYLDCYESPTITGKVGDDIINGKLTWLLVMAMESANEEQKATIMKYYGGKLPQDEKEIRKMYKILEIQKKYHKFEDETYRSLVFMAKRFPSSIPSTPFIAMLHKIYKRSK